MTLVRHLAWGRVCALLLCAVSAVISVSCERSRGAAVSGKKVIILGVDGLDPDLLTKFMADGKMPNFARLAQRAKAIGHLVGIHQRIGAMNEEHVDVVGVQKFQ